MNNILDKNPYKKGTNKWLEYELIRAPFLEHLADREKTEKDRISRALNAADATCNKKNKIKGDLS